MRVFLNDSARWRSGRLLAAALLLPFSACARTVGVTAPDAAPRAAMTTADHQIAFWEKRLPRDPEDDTAKRALAAAYLRKARESGDFSYYPKTEALLEPIAASPAADTSTQTLLASAKAAQHKFGEAALLAEKAVNTDPRDEAAHALLFDTRLELGNLPAAKTSLDTLRSLAPGFESLTREANYQIVIGDTKGAISSLTAALQDAETRGLPANDQSWTQVRLGAICYDHGRFECAEQHYRSALALTPDNHLPLEHVAELRASEGNYGEALKIYERVVALAPHPEFFEAVGSVHQAMRQPAVSEEWFNRAEQAALAQLDEGDVGVYRYLAKFYSDVEPDPVKAVRYARADLGVRQDIFTHETLAWALYRSGQNSEAIAAMKQALSTGVKNAEIFCHAAAIADSQHDSTQTAAYRRLVLEVNPRYPVEECGAEA